MTFGKVMGGGFPAAAFGGRADVMAMLSPEGPVYQAGTLSGNPVATTAGLTTLRLATDEVYAQIDRAAALLARGGRQALTEAGVPHVVQSGGNMFSVFFTDDARRRGPRLRRRELAARRALQGVLPLRCSTRASTCRRAPSRRGSSPRRTTTRALDRVVSALPAAARAAAAAPARGDR